MRLTRPAAALAVICAGVLALQGCSGSSSTGSGGKALTVLVSAKAAFPAQQKQWFRDISAAFQKETGTTVQFETFATAADEQKKIQVSTVSGTGPDIYSIGISFTPVADATGAFITLGKEQWDAIGGRDAFVPAALGESGRTKDTEIAVPFISRPYTMAYNTKMFKAAGIDAPPATWDEFMAAAKKLTRKDVYGAAVAYADQYDPWKFIWTMSASAGNQIAEGSKARLDDPTVKAAYETYFSWVTSEGIVDPAAVSWTNAQAVAAFAAGNAAMVPMVTPGSYPALTASKVKDDWAYAPMPTVPAGHTSRPDGGIDAASTISGDNLVVADYSENQDLALRFIKFITGEEQQLHYFKVFGELPANAAAAKKVAGQFPVYGPVIEAQERSVPTPYTGGWSDIQVALGNVVAQSRAELSAKVVSDQHLSALLADAQTAAQSALDRAGRNG